MQLYIDTANLDEIREALSWGIVDGITTNPSLIKKEVLRLKAEGAQVSFDGHIKQILQLAGNKRPVSLEVTANTTKEMILQAQHLHEHYNGVAQNVVIKVPVDADLSETHDFDALKVIETLESQNIPVNCTLIFTPEQALLAAKAGATYVSPFCGRLDDYIRAQNGVEFAKEDYFPAEGWATEEEDDTLDDNGIVSGVDLVEKIAELFEKYGMDCNIIAASLRNTRQVREVALAGATIATVPFTHIKEMIRHPKTKEGMQQFTADVVPEYQALVSGIMQTQGVAPAWPQQNQTAPAQPQTPTQPTPQVPSQPAPAAPQQVPQQQPVQPRPAPNAYDLARQQPQ